MSVKISELPILDSLADNDVLAGVDTSANATKKIELATLKDYIDTNTTYTAGTNIDITNNVVSAPNVYNKDEMDSQIEELQSEVDSLSTIFNAFPTESGEGESLTLDGTAETKFKKIDLKGNTSQTGTPTPTNPIPVNVVSGDNDIVVCGKNLFDIYNATGTRGTNTITATNQEITINSNSSGTEMAFYLNDVSQVSQWLVTSYANAKDYNMTTTGGNYTLVLYFSSKPTNNMSIVLATNKRLIQKTTTDNWENNTIKWSVTLESDEYIKSIQAYTPGTNVFNNLKIKAQLEKGSSVTTYEPYQCNTYDVDLIISKNLFNKNNANLIYNYALTNEGTGWYPENYDYCLYIKCKKNTTYTISKTNSDRLRAVTTIYNPITLPQTYQYTNSNDTTKLTITTNENANYLIVFFRRYSDTLTKEQLLDTIQIEYGSTPTTYEAYSSMELCKIGTYQDYIYKSEGNWYKHSDLTKVVLNGSESWVDQTNGAYTTNRTDKYSRYGMDILMCNYFPLRTGTSTSNYFGIDNDTTRLRFWNVGMSIEDFKTWLSTHNTTVYYQLATTVDTQITYQPLIDQLNAIEQATSKNGETNISQINNDLPFIIYAEAIMSLQNVLDRIELLES